MEREELAIAPYDGAREFDRRSFLFGTAAMAAALALVPIAPRKAYASPSERVSVSVPTTLAFKVKGDGTLVGPSSEAFRIVNSSEGLEIRVSDIKATPGSGFSFVADASASQEPNAVQVEVSSKGDSVSLANATGSAGTAVGDEMSWTMASRGANASLEHLDITASGRISNYDPQALRTEASAGSIDWYLADDTLTNEIMERTAALEAANAALEEDLDDFYALLTAAELLPREVYVSSPVNGTVTVDTTPALWLNLDDGQLYLIEA